MFGLTAACLSDKGLIRAKQEDNFLFQGQHADPLRAACRYHNIMSTFSDRPAIFAVFDGIGGEQYGEYAAYEAAHCLQEQAMEFTKVSGAKVLLSACDKMNSAVLDRQKTLMVEKMGTTVSMLLFTGDTVYSCNIGDSRAYRLRGKVFSQLSRDHLMIGGNKPREKAPLSQYLGIDTTEMRLEPHLYSDTVEHGDRYLLSTDGLTDMMGNLEIEEIMESSESVESCAARLVEQALKNGGRDNITVIVCEIEANPRITE